MKHRLDAAHACLLPAGRVWPLVPVSHPLVLGHSPARRLSRRWCRMPGRAVMCTCLTDGSCLFGRKQRPHRENARLFSAFLTARQPSALLPRERSRRYSFFRARRDMPPRIAAGAATRTAEKKVLTRSFGWLRTATRCVTLAPSQPARHPRAQRRLCCVFRSAVTRAPKVARPARGSSACTHRIGQRTGSLST